MRLAQPARLLSTVCRPSTPQPFSAVLRSSPHTVTSRIISNAALLSCARAGFSTLALNRQQGKQHTGEQQNASSSFSWSTVGMSTLVLVGSSLLLLPSAPAVAHAETVSVAAQPVFQEPLPPPIQLTYPESFFRASRSSHFIRRPRPPPSPCTACTVESTGASVPGAAVLVVLCVPEACTGVVGPSIRQIRSMGVHSPRRVQ